MPATTSEIVGLGLGALQTGVGIVGDIINKGKQKKYLSQLKPYQTPQEIYDVLNATENNASQGYDPFTLNYLTNQTDQAFSTGINAATQLGADPNTLSSLFGQKLDATMAIGAQNHNLNMQNFAQYLTALNTVASNKAAEQKSKQDLIKDKLQAVGLNLQQGNQNISGGLNTILSSLSAIDIGNLYNPDGTLKKKTAPTLAVDNTDQGNFSSYRRGYMV